VKVDILTVVAGIAMNIAFWFWIYPSILRWLGWGL
jgi:hypothetical protein